MGAPSSRSLSRYGIVYAEATTPRRLAPGCGCLLGLAVACTRALGRVAVDSLRLRIDDHSGVVARPGKRHVAVEKNFQHPRRPRPHRIAPAAAASGQDFESVARF